MQEKSIALFDIDKTIYHGYTLLDCISAQESAGIITKNYVQEIVELHNQLKRGVLDYETAVAKVLIIWAQALKGKSYTEILENTRDVLHQNKQKLYPFVNATVTALKPTHRIILITGEPQFIAQVMTETVGADQSVSTIYEVVNGRFTGDISMLLADRTQKEAQVRKISSENSDQNSYAFGDSEADILMLSLVKHPICIDPSPELRQIAVSRNWRIISEPQNIHESLLFENNR